MSLDTAPQPTAGDGVAPGCTPCPSLLLLFLRLPPQCPPTTGARLRRRPARGRPGAAEGRHHRGHQSVEGVRAGLGRHPSPAARAEPEVIGPIETTTGGTPPAPSRSTVRSTVEDEVKAMASARRAAATSSGPGAPATVR